LTAVHQFLPTFAAGDAIGQHVLRLRDALREAGYESEIFADEAQPAVRRQSRPYRQFKGSSGPALMLYHLSTGSPMAEFLAEQAGTGDRRLAVYYHNITPPEFFERWEPGAAENVRTARGELRKLAGPTGFAMANSTFSEAELIDEGYGDTAVVPVLIDFAELETTPPDPATLARGRRAAEGGGAQWLFVGRLAPNKCQHDVIGAFATYRAVFDPDARLTLVGGKTSELYHRALEQLVDELDLGGAVDLADVVTFPELLAHYRTASVFVSASEHEGFCVPLLEAMHFGLPVVARPATAVPETVGEAALLVEDRDPLVMATAVHRVLSDGALRERLVAAGRERVDHFSLDSNRRRLLDVVTAHARGLGGVPPR
jgi:glycosyltransferase involved in cell wall biosynthesis